LDIIFNLLLFNANQIFRELVIIKKGFEDAVSISRDSYERLLLIEKLIKEKPDDLDDSILLFVDSVREVTIMYGNHSLTQHILDEIKRDQYTRKPFKELQKDLIGLAMLQTEMCKKVFADPNFLKQSYSSSIIELANAEWLPLCEQYI
jgi:hypothetical protein